MLVICAKYVAKLKNNKNNVLQIWQLNTSLLLIVLIQLVEEC